MIWVTPVSEESNIVCDGCKRNKSIVILHIAQHNEISGKLDNVKYMIRLCKHCKIKIIDGLTQIEST